MNPASTIKRLLFRLCALMAGLFIGLLLAEGVCRFHAFGLSAFDFKITNSFVAIGYSDYLQPAENQYVWNELKPNIEDRFKMHTFRTNSKGLRDKEYIIKKPKNTYRVAVIGDSYSLGDGVEAEEIYHSILEEKLNNLSDSIQFEFINFGLSGYDMLNYLGVIEAKAMAYNPDLILIGFCGNNDDDLPEARQYTEPFKGYIYSEWSWAVQRFQIIRTVANYINIHGRKKNETAVDEKSKRKKEFVKNIFSEFKRVEKEQTIPFMVFYMHMQDASPEKAKMVNDLCEKNNFRFIDSSPTVEKIADISKYWFHDSDHHPNEMMHGIYAELLMREFVRVEVP